MLQVIAMGKRLINNPYSVVLRMRGIEDAEPWPTIAAQMYGIGMTLLA